MINFINIGDVEKKQTIFIEKQKMLMNIIGMNIKNKKIAIYFKILAIG